MITDTLKRIENGENVVGGNPEGTVGEEGETPGDTEHEAQSHDGHQAYAAFVDLLVVLLVSLEKTEPCHHDGEGDEGEDEDDSIVADVDNVVDVPVSYPAPGNRSLCQ